jgi:hypothetical protein
MKVKYLGNVLNESVQASNRALSDKEEEKKKKGDTCDLAIQRKSRKVRLGAAFHTMKSYLRTAPCSAA